MARIKIDYDDNNLKRNLASFSNNLNRNISAVMDYNAAYAVGWLKQNAPWHDNTGAARSGLTSISFNYRNSHEIIMSYSVYYGIWLEVAHSGKWAVIIPGMRVIGNKVMNDMVMLINASIKGIR